MTTKQATRRRILKTGSAVIPAFSIVPSRVFGANERLNVACVGIGGIAKQNIGACSDENIVALCDVDSNYAKKVFNAYPTAKRYVDYRVMLEKQKDIDAVIIATPDHTHAVITMAAIQAGKHVYCQKPLAHTVFETRALTKAARESNVQTQLGNQGHSAEGIRLVREWIQSGALGEVKEVHAWTDRPDSGPWYANFAARELPTQSEAIPAGLDWDLWLGPASEHPYHRAYHPSGWRAWLDFGTGALGDMGCHILDPACWALDLMNPLSITAEVKHHRPELKGLAHPIASRVTYQFGKRGNLCPMKLVWHDGTYEVPRPPMLEEGRKLPASGAVIYGTKETLIHDSHGAAGIRIIPETRMKKFQRPEKTIPRVKGGHENDWIRACKDGQPASSNFADYGGQLTEMVLLGMVAQRLPGEVLNWNGGKMKFDQPEANQFLHTQYRKGWSL